MFYRDFPKWNTLTLNLIPQPYLNGAISILLFEMSDVKAKDIKRKCTLKYRLAATKIRHFPKLKRATGTGIAAS